MLSYPKHFMISSGKGFSKHQLVAFDNALINAGISNYNLLRVSSILPIGCCLSEYIDIKEGSPLLVAYGSITCINENRIVSSAVAVGIPQNEDDIGVIMECAGFYDSEVAKKLVVNMVEEAMNNHGIQCKEIISSSIEAAGIKDGCVSVISAIALW